MRPYAETTTTPPTHTAYADVVDLRTAFGIAASDAAASAELTKAIEVASRQIDGYCGRGFARLTSRAEFKTAQFLYLAHYPIVSVQSVVDRHGDDLVYAVQNDAWIELDLYAGSGRAPIVVSYEAGYELPGTATPNLPADLAQACIDLARGIYTRRSRNPDISSESVAGIADVAFTPTSIPLGTRALLDPYRALFV